MSNRKNLFYLYKLISNNIRFDVGFAYCESINISCVIVYFDFTTMWEFTMYRWTIWQLAFA